MNYEEITKKMVTRIGGADISTIMGTNPYETLDDLYLKLIGVKKIEPNKYMEIGLLFEETIAKHYQQQYGGKLVKADKKAHPVYPFMVGSADYFIDDDILEIKTTSKRLSKTLNDNYYYQVMHYLDVYNKYKGIVYIFSFTDLEFKKFEVLKNDLIIKEKNDKVLEFVEKYFSPQKELSDYNKIVNDNNIEIPF